MKGTTGIRWGLGVCVFVCVEEAIISHREVQRFYFFCTTRDIYTHLHTQTDIYTCTHSHMLVARLKHFADAWPGGCGGGDRGGGGAGETARESRVVADGTKQGIEAEEYRRPIQRKWWININNNLARWCRWKMRRPPPKGRERTTRREHPSRRVVVLDSWMKHQPENRSEGVNDRHLNYLVARANDVRA